MRVLIVDDERSVADTLAMVVESFGFIARVAYSGEEATTVADDLLPQVALSDVMMPGMDGFALATWLEEHHPDCRVLLLSGHLDIVAEVESEAIGGDAQAILAKPVHPQEIGAFLRACAMKESPIP
jgi:DNA-binding response OmpR family regulator